MGFGTEIVFALMLGFLVLGPKRLHTMLLDAARAKAKFVEASRGFKSELAAELDAEPGAGKTDGSDDESRPGERLDDARDGQQRAVALISEACQR